MLALTCVLESGDNWLSCFFSFCSVAVLTVVAELHEQMSAVYTESLLNAHALYVHYQHTCEIKASSWITLSARFVYACQDRICTCPPVLSLCIAA